MTVCADGACLLLSSVYLQSAWVRRWLIMVVIMHGLSLITHPNVKRMNDATDDIYNDPGKLILNFVQKDFLFLCIIGVIVIISSLVLCVLFDCTLHVYTSYKLCYSDCGNPAVFTLKFVQRYDELTL